MRGFGLVLLAFACLAGDAAAVTLVSPDGTVAQPFQRWADRSAMPTPRGRVTLDRDTAICGEAVACTTAVPPTIWFGRDADRGDFLHELGHQFDYRLMTGGRRYKFERIMRYPHGWRTRIYKRIGNVIAWTANNERFAEAYRLCALRPRSISGGSIGYLYDPSTRQHRLVCELIVETAKSSSRR